MEFSSGMLKTRLLTLQSVGCCREIVMYIDGQTA